MFHLKLLINFLSLSIAGQIDWYALGRNSQGRLVLRWSQADLQPCSIKQIISACPWDPTIVMATHNNSDIFVVPYEDLPDDDKDVISKAIEEF